VSAPPPKKKKKFALPYREILTPNVPIQYWNNGKMKITYNSAYVQIEMFNCTFAQQAIIVYGYLCANFQEIASPNT